MNNEFYKFALDILESLTTEEIEVGLKEFGIECSRKVAVFSADDIAKFCKFGISFPATNSRKFFSYDDLSSLDYAANDNSFALAA